MLPPGEARRTLPFGKKGTLRDGERALLNRERGGRERGKPGREVRRRKRRESPLGRLIGPAHSLSRTVFCLLSRVPQSGVLRARPPAPRGVLCVWRALLASPGSVGTVLD